MKIIIVIFLNLVVYSRVYSDVKLCDKSLSSPYQNYTTTKIELCDCDDFSYCLRKCCQHGYYHQRIEDGRNDIFESICIKNPNYTYSTFFSVPVYEGTILKENISRFKIGMLLCNNTQFKYQYFKMNPWNPQEKYYIQANGSLYYPESLKKMYDNSRFCVDEEDGLSVYLCYSPEPMDIYLDRVGTVFGMIISMPFLLVTFLVYAILPESNIHRRSLMCYVLSLLIGYIFLVSIQLNNNFIETFWCHFLGYGIIFFFICSFFWMNVMCIDMWLAFSGLRGFKGKRSTERKRFLAYFAYAVGMPLLLIFIVFLMNTYADEDSIFHPKLGGARCFVEEGYPNLFYFSLPMAIILLINVILFILTSVRIQQVKKETSMLKQSDSKRHTYEEEKQKFNLYLKLSLAMGINWIMEVISWAVGWKLKTVPAYIWYLTDFTNAAYGVLIFFIFVFKKKIWVGLKKKYYVFIGKPHLAHTLSTSHPARTSNYSTTDTAVSTDYRLSDVKNGKGEDRPLSRN